jgi:phosphoserine phosphatase RsbU/P
MEAGWFGAASGPPDQQLTAEWIGTPGGSFSMASPHRRSSRSTVRLGISLLVVLIATVRLVSAQTADLRHLREPRFLDMGWLAEPGDDPAYAGAGFNDSGWMHFDPYSQISLICGGEEPEVVWYRLHMRVDPSATGLALNIHNLSRAFEVYVNGERLITVGRVEPYEPYSQVARAPVRIPDRIVESANIVVAMRVHISAPEWGTGEGRGLYATDVAIGQYDTVRRDNWLSVIGENAFDWFDRLLLISLGFVALVLFASQRCRYEYLWIFAVGALTLLETPVPVIRAFRNIPGYWEFLSLLPHLAAPFLWASLYASFIHQRLGWRWRIYLAIAGALIVINGLHGLYLDLPDWFRLIAPLPYMLLLSVLVPIVLAVHWRRGNREAGILLIPITLFSLYIYAQVALGTMYELSACRDFAIRGFNMIDRYPLGPFSVSLDTLSDILCSLSLAFIMILRSSNLSRRQALIEAELEAAQQVQQVLVPERLCEVPGFRVASVYQPAQQVGGDFFQVLPADDSGLLLVMGDVAGKGLPAAMLVSVLVGAIRGIAEFTCAPAAILSNLNERLVGKAGGGFSTAVVAHISAEGQVKISNAGHLSPYLDGEEIALPGALPLGVASGATYDTSEFILPHGARLTFYSDGVVEAQNHKGELFGFERSRALSTHPVDVIARSAVNFGQQDDITVVTIEREGAILVEEEDLSTAQALCPPVSA